MSATLDLPIRGMRIIPGLRTVAPAATAKYKFAFGLFSDPSEMLLAANDLSGWGVPRDRLSLVICPEHLSFDLRAAANCNSSSPLARIIASRPAATPYAWVVRLLDAASGESFSVADIEALDHREPLDEQVGQWAQERPALQLHDFVCSGGGLLIVRLTSDSEQHVVCSTLLHHASQGVQTHEIRRRAGSANTV